MRPPRKLVPQESGDRFVIRAYSDKSDRLASGKSRCVQNEVIPQARGSEYRPTANVVFVGANPASSHFVSAAVTPLLQSYRDSISIGQHFFWASPFSKCEQLCLAWHLNSSRNCGTISRVAYRNKAKHRG